MKEISVIMALYKEPLAFLRASIDSTIESISRFDHEFIIIVDNPDPVDEVKNYLSDLNNKNNNIIIFFNSSNVGLALCLNLAIDLSCGKYIMRMDADDICYPNRAQVQLDFLEENSSVDMIGSSVTRIDSTGESIGLSKASSYKSQQQQKNDLRVRSICYHPTWFGRSEVFKELKYNNLQCAQDIEFLFRSIERNIEIRNISEPLLYYRINAGSLSLSKGFEQTVIRYCLNRVYINDVDFDKLSEKISQMIENRGYVSWAFERFHSKYINSLNEKKYLYILFVGLVSPLHLYKNYLLLKSKLSS